MKKAVFALIMLGLAANPLHAAEKLSPEELKTLYAVGASVARSLTVFSLTAAEMEVVLQGIAETRAGKNPDFDLNAYNPKVQELAKVRRKAAGVKQALTGKEYLEKAAKEKGAVKTESGMVYLSLTEGKGGSPKANDDVTVNYRGKLIDGKEFDSSYKRGAS